METVAVEQIVESGPKVVFRNGPLRGQVLALEKDRTSLGRDPRNDVAIHDDIISSFHAAILRDAGTFYLEDAGSKNGTFLNGERVDRAELKDGDVFCLCLTGPELQFTCGKPILPTIVESTTATFARTRSIGRALRELLPSRRSGLTGLMSLTGVRRIADFKLEEATRRTRLLFLGLSGLFLTLCTAALVATVLIGRGGRDGSPTLASSADTAGPGKHVSRLVVNLEPIYGSLFLSYRESPIGEVEVTNLGESLLEGAELDFRFEGAAAAFLVEPFSAGVPEIAPGGAARVTVRPKLSAEVLSAQTREVTATVTLLWGGEVLERVSRAVFVHGRNTFNWEKPERVAVFVDPNDPAVREFVERAWEHRPPVNREECPPPRIVGALTVLTALASFGLSYRPDSGNPISESIDRKANDRVSYPGETLLARSGDCDDLTVLSCAVLEAVGVPTAFVVASGHVFLLLDTGLAAETLPQTPFDPDTVVVWRGKVWMPIEATDLARPGASFATAWSAAWPHSPGVSAGETKVFELKEAWRDYQPMNPPPDEDVSRRISAALGRAFEGLTERVGFAVESVRKLLTENLSRRISEIEKSTEAGPARDQATGLLFARNGLFGEARRVFERAIFGEGGAPGGGAADWGNELKEETAILLADLALCITLGAHSRADLDAAARYGEAAADTFPPEAAREKGELMLKVALVHHLRGDLSAARAWSGKALRLDPALGETYRRLMTAEGPVAGPTDEILQFLRQGL